MISRVNIMIAKGKYIFATAFALGLIYSSSSAWAGIFSDSWRYRMTVVVETPEGIKTGSAVREISVHGGIHLLPEMSPRVDVEGEAIAVDLGVRGVLFALMRGEQSGSQNYEREILFESFHGSKNIQGRVVLSEDNYPMIVRFRDLKDPRTVEARLDIRGCHDNQRFPDGRCMIADAYVAADRLDEFFGKG